MQRRECGGTLKISSLKPGGPGPSREEVDARQRAEEPFEPGSFSQKV